jgi:hypothetical protein
MSDTRVITPTVSGKSPDKRGMDALQALSYSPVFCRISSDMLLDCA